MPIYARDFKSLDPSRKFPFISGTEGNIFSLSKNFQTNSKGFHYRDNYGFITFLNKKDAFSAIEHGNDDTSNPKVDLCFGGRRAFCKEKYADLGKNQPLFIAALYSNDIMFSDSGPSDSRRNGRYGKSAMLMMQMSPRSPALRSNEDEEDFDALLKQARAGIRKS